MKLPYGYQLIYLGRCAGFQKGYIEASLVNSENGPIGDVHESLDRALAISLPSACHEVPERVPVIYITRPGKISIIDIVVYSPTAIDDL